jgi:hypothetical protein
MKRTLFALALLVPALASAVVKLDVEVAHNDTTAEKSFEFSEGNSQVITPSECGSVVEMTLVKEGETSADFVIKVSQDDETKCESDVTLNYGEVEEFSCAKADVNASVKYVATKVAEEKAA